MMYGAGNMASVARVGRCPSKTWAKRDFDQGEDAVRGSNPTGIDATRTIVRTDGGDSEARRLTDARVQLQASQIRRAGGVRANPSIACHPQRGRICADSTRASY